MRTGTTSFYARSALTKAQTGQRLTGNEARRVARMPDIVLNYRPLGTAPMTLADRIYTVQDPTGVASASGSSVGVVRGSDGKIINVVGASGGGSVYPTVLKVVNGSTSITLDSTGITIDSGSHTVVIAFADIAHNVTLQTTGYCDGTNKHVDALRSASY